MKLHQTIRNIYLKKIIPLFSIEILTENNKWNKIDSINITEKTEFYLVKTKHHSLLCTKNHILIDADNNELLAIKSINKLVKTTDGIEKVISVEKTNTYDNAYDVSLNAKTDHLYIANGFLSHNCVILDEFAFLQKNIADKLFTSMYPVISSSKEGKFIIVSTPNGMDNLYYDIWQQANSKDKLKNLDGWKAFSMYWWQVPGHDEAWKERQIAAIGETRFAQEFNNEFLAGTSTRKLIPSNILEKFRIQYSELKAKSKEFLQGKKHHVISQDETKMYEFTMWHEFDAKRTYVATGDVAEGGGGDSSVLYVWDITDLSDIAMCAMFESDKASITEFAYITMKILSLYSNPYYICERNGVGAGYIDTLRITYQYQNLVQEGKNNEFGVFSHVSVKSKACLWTRDMMTTEGFGFKLYDKSLIDEMSTFVKKDTKGVYLSYTSLAGAHDDHIMAFIWLCYLLQSDIIEKYFVVCETFKDILGNTHAKTVLPQSAYTPQQIKKVVDDPMYQEFLDFKDALMNKLGKALQLESKQDNDGFIYQQNYDPYFGGSRNEPSWNAGYSNQLQSAQDLNPNNRMPAFFIT